MSNYSYVAINPDGVETRGILEVPDQIEAVRRIKEMGLFPTKVLAERERSESPTRKRSAGQQRRRFPASTCLALEAG